MNAIAKYLPKLVKPECLIVSTPLGGYSIYGGTASVRELLKDELEEKRDEFGHIIDWDKVPSQRDVVSAIYKLGSKIEWVEVPSFDYSYPEGTVT